MRFLAVDFETSGLDPQKNAPVSMGVALFDDGVLLEEKEWLIGPKMRDGKVQRSYEVQALLISQTSWKDIVNASPPGQICQEITEFADFYQLRHIPIVAFNAPFDLSFYSALLFDAGNWNHQEQCFDAFKPPFVGPWHCARLLAFEAVTLPKYSLDAVAAHFNMQRVGKGHGAMEDAVMAGRIFIALNQLLEARHEL